MHEILLILHIIGAGVLVGMIAVALMIIFSKTVIVDRWKLFGMFGRLGMIAAGWQLLTGIGLYLLEPDNFKSSTLFWVKIGLFVLDGIIATQIVDRRVRSVSTNKESASAGILSTAYLANFLIISAIITLGVLIAD